MCSAGPGLHCQRVSGRIFPATNIFQWRTAYDTVFITVKSIHESRGECKVLMLLPFPLILSFLYTLVQGVSKADVIALFSSVGKRPPWTLHPPYSRVSLLTIHWHTHHQVSYACLLLCPLPQLFAYCWECCGVETKLWEYLQPCVPRGQHHVVSWGGGTYTGLPVSEKSWRIFQMLWYSDISHSWAVPQKQTR